MKVLRAFPLTFAASHAGSSSYNNLWFIVLQKGCYIGTVVEEHYEFFYRWRNLPKILLSLATGKYKKVLAEMEEYGGAVNAVANLGRENLGHLYDYCLDQAVYKYKNSSGWYTDLWPTLTVEMVADRIYSKAQKPEVYAEAVRLRGKLLNMWVNNL